MDKNNPEILEKIRQQFDALPYPKFPLEKSPAEDAFFLYLHHLVTPYYLRNKKVIETEGKFILDAGCGSGYKALALAQANPGARIIGIDISNESVKVAQQRLLYHGYEQAEFHVLRLEDLPSLGMHFDYINCDEVLYLLPDAVAGLQAMKSVLKPQGIIRSNLHSSRQRVNYYRAQEFFREMGLMDSNPREAEIEVVQETMNALKDQVFLKAATWYPQREKDEQWYLANYLLQGDKGYTIPEMFSALEAAGLEFISMVNWQQWELMDLFKEPDNLPVFLGLSLPEASIEQRLHLYELLNPVYRLLDFWCGHPNQAQAYVPVTDWTTSQWQEAKIHLHPQLKTEAVKAELARCITQLHPFEISKQLPIARVQVSLDSTIAACVLLPLIEEAQSMQSLIKHWQTLRPLDPLTLEPVVESQVFDLVKQVLLGLEAFGYVLLESLT